VKTDKYAVTTITQDLKITNAENTFDGEYCLNPYERHHDDAHYYVHKQDLSSIRSKNDNLRMIISTITTYSNRTGLLWIVTKQPYKMIAERIIQKQNIVNETSDTASQLNDKNNNQMDNKDDFKEARIENMIETSKMDAEASIKKFALATFVTDSKYDWHPPDDGDKKQEWYYVDNIDVLQESFVEVVTSIEEEVQLSDTNMKLTRIEEPTHTIALNSKLFAKACKDDDDDHNYHDITLLHKLYFLIITLLHEYCHAKRNIDFGRKPTPCYDGEGGIVLQLRLFHVIPHFLFGYEGPFALDAVPSYNQLAKAKLINPHLIEYIQKYDQLKNSSK